ncbi:hypothetical protein BC629DRAFT_1537345 [Irpex lacteus]|nr:hypothetical protein BC629DRAFT_1537345 [Irpex lacteus]
MLGAWGLEARDALLFMAIYGVWATQCPINYWLGSDGATLGWSSCGQNNRCRKFCYRTTSAVISHTMFGPDQPTYFMENRKSGM